MVTFVIAVANTGHAPAYDVVIQDVLPAGLTAASVVSITDGMNPPTTLTPSGSLAGGYVFPGPIPGVPSPPDGSNIIVITFTATVVTPTAPGASILNNAQINQYRGTPTGANHASTPIVDGATLTGASPSLDKTITATNQPHTAPEAAPWPAAIGEVVSYSVVIAVPELTMTGVSFVDTLGPGLVPLNVPAPVVTLSAGLTATSTTLVVGGSTITIPFGAVTNTNTANPTAETITITYSAQVANVAQNQDGVLVPNGAVFAYDGGQTDDSENVTVREPLLQVAKSFTPSTADAGDTVSLLITVSHPSASSLDAFEVTLSDVIPAGLTPVGTPTCSGGANNTLCSISTNTLSAAWTTIPRLGAGSTQTLSIPVTVDVTNAAGTVLNNTANTAWTSLPGVVTGERTGAGGVNDHSASGQATLAITAAVPQKELLTPATATIGETIRYRLTLTVPEGTSPLTQMVDTLPPGTSYVSFGNVQANNATIPLSYSGPTVSPGSGTGPQTFSFGTVTNNDSDPDIETISLEVTVRVDNVVGNQAGASLVNAVEATVNGVSQGSSDAPVVTVVEPSLALTKSVLPASGDAGDVFTFTVAVANPGGANGATAYDAVIRDTVPASYTLNTSSVTNNCGGSNGSAGNQLQVTCPSIATGATVTITYQATLVATTQAGQTTTNVAAVEWTSLPGSVAGERGGPSSGPNPPNDYRSQDDATTTTPAPTFAKLVVPPTSLAVGELATYRIRVTVPEGLTYGVTVTDLVPPGLGYVAGSAAIDAASFGGITPTVTTSCSGTCASGDDVTFQFGSPVTATNDNNTANNSFDVVFQLRVMNAIGNQLGTSLVNQATMTYTDPDTGATPAQITGGGGTTANAAPVAVKEPILDLTKGISSLPNPADAGGVVTYQLAIAHTGASNSDAHNIVVTDTMPPDLSLIVGSISVVQSPGSCATGLSTAGSSATALSVTATLLPLGCSLNVTYDATIGGSVTPGDTIQNASELRWGSIAGADGDPDGGRNGEDGPLGGGALNDYRDNDVASFGIGGEVSIAKDLYATSLADTPGGNLTIGEIATFELAVTLPEGTFVSLAVVDDLPPGLAYVPGSAVLDTSGFAGTATLPLATCGACGSGDDVSFAFTNIVVTADNNATNNTFRIRIQARVLDIPGNVGVPAGSQTQLPNAATAQRSGGPLQTSPAVTTQVVEPQIEITKTLTPPSAAANDVVTIVLQVTNPGTSTAYDVTVSDLLPAGLLNPQHVSIAGGSGFIPSFAGTTAGYINGSVPAGVTVTFTFTAQLASGVAADSVIVNTASVSGASSLPGAETNERIVSDDQAQDDVTVTAPDVAVTKDDGGVTTLAGGTVVYTLGYRNFGDSEATGVVITEVVPANSTFNPGASTAGWVCTPNGNAGGTCTIYVGTLAAGSVPATVTFAVTVSNPVAAGVTQIDNTASISDDGQNGADRDSDNNSDPDATPVEATPDFSLTKNDDGATAYPGGTVVYRLDYTNSGTQGATGVVITEVVPPRTTFVPAASSSGWTCIPGNSAGSTCTFVVGNLAGGGASGSVDFALIVDEPTAAEPPIENGAAIADDGTNGTDPTPDNNSAQDSTPIVPQADLSLTKTVSTAQPDLGSNVTFTVTVTNAGPNDATGVLVTDQLPAGLTHVSHAGPGTYTPGTGTWAIGAIPEGTSVSLQITAKVVGTGSITNVARVTSASEFDPDSTPGPTGLDEDDDDFAALNPRYADLSLTKAATVSGTTVTYVLTVRNDGVSPATGVVVRDRLPAGLTYVSSTPAGQYDPVSGDWAVGSLAVGQVKTLTIVASGTGSFTNIAEILRSDQSDLDSTPGNGVTGEDDIGVRPSTLQAAATPTPTPQPQPGVTQTPQPTAMSSPAASLPSVAAATPPGVTAAVAPTASMQPSVDVTPRPPRTGGGPSVFGTALPRPISDLAVAGSAAFAVVFCWWLLRRRRAK